MTICLFGNYITDYPRIAVLRKGLLANGALLVECHTRFRGFRKYWALYRQHRALNDQYDILLVGMAGYSLVWFARWLTAKPVVFDAFVSLYLTDVEDRARSVAGGWRGRYLRILEKTACYMASLVLLDTNEQINYFVKQYQLPVDKFVRIPVGANEEVFFPKPANPAGTPAKFILHWHGHIVPFHGVETILQAAALLSSETDIEFRLITRFNSQYRAMVTLVQRLGLGNVSFFPETDYRGLAAAMNQADVCLGVFGNNRKGQLVVPNKIYEAAACAKPIITADTAAVREIFPDGVLVRCAAGDPRALAEEILLLRNDPAKRQTLGKNIYEFYTRELKPEIICRKLLEQLQLIKSA